MARRRTRVAIRDGKWNTAVYQMGMLVREQFNEVWKENIEDLEYCAEDIEDAAHYLVPKNTGALDSSIFVYVTKSRRYPGIIAVASVRTSAKGRYAAEGYTYFDYALIQEENEEYQHDKYMGESAHYLGGPFAFYVARYYKQATGNKLTLNSDLAHAYNYTRSLIKRYENE